MCGIWGYLSFFKSVVDLQKLFNSFISVKNRGPDRSDFKIINEFMNIYLGFHRLAIMDKSIYGDQPFVKEFKSTVVYCMCNGEIYNYHQIVKDNDFSSQLMGKSDCEVIPLLYAKYGFLDMLNKLRSESAICILEINHEDNTIKLMLSRDHLGVRPLYFGMDDNGIAFASTLNGINGLVDHKSVRQLDCAEALTITIKLDNKSETQKLETTIKSDHYFNLNISTNHSYDSNFDFDTTNIPIQKLIPKTVFDQIHDKLVEAVELRLESDRPIGALLSGGLDSSLVVSIAASYLKKHNKKLRTFSIGMPGSTDKEYAEMVSKHCDTEHEHVEFTEQDFLDAIENVVIATETYDITTIRASAGQYLISKWINENTNIKCLLNGDGSDELTSGYMYFHKAPNSYESHLENIRLLEEIRYYDVQRVDKCVSYNGLEARVPFLDHEFVSLYLSIPHDYRIPLKEDDNGRNIEKWLLRKSFDRVIPISNPESKTRSYLPTEVLWRKKEAFSDGVSSQKKSWYQIIQESLEKIYTTSDMEKEEVTNHITPHTYEALHYRLLFNKHFNSKLAHIIPHYWLPKWSGNIKEPSARVLSVY